MPRFYFHVIDGTELFDQDGTELPDLKTAKAEAVKLAGAVLKSADPEKIWGDAEWKVVVKDCHYQDSGRTYFSIKILAKDL